MRWICGLAYPGIKPVVSLRCSTKAVSMEFFPALNFPLSLRVIQPWHTAGIVLSVLIRVLSGFCFLVNSSSLKWNFYTYWFIWPLFLKEILLHSPHWAETCHPLVSEHYIPGLYLCTTTPSLQFLNRKEVHQ